MDRRRVSCSAAAALAGALFGATGARAQGGDDRAVADAIVRQLEADAAHRPATAEALQRSKQALERGTRLRAAGDEAHAKAADGLAREWAETARDLVRAVDAEAAASESRRKAVEAQAALERAKAQVEEAIARVGRLKAELADASPGGKDRVAVEVHDDGSGAPKKRPKGGKKPPPAAPASTP